MGILEPDSAKRGGERDRKLREAPGRPPAPVSITRRDVFVLGGFLVFLLIFFNGILTMPGERCLGRAGLDAQDQFYGWRAYGFGEIRAGRFPLWNPYELLGMPFVASLQSAMFYPTNWLCAVLPLCRAINLGIILNLFLSGLFTYLWARRFGLRWIGAIVAAATYVFGAPQILRIFVGHWSVLAPMPWIPCILLCVEILVGDGFQPLAIVLGAVAVAMEWFGGNPQYAFYGGITAVLYLVGRLWQRRELGARGAARVIGSFVLIYLLGSALAGVQLMPTLELFSVSSRRSPHSYASVAEYSFVPEGLLSFVAPDFFGTDVGVRYWGRWYLWETSPYVGVAAFGLALIALLRGRRGKAFLPGCIALICLLLAMAGDAVFFGLLPGFDLFRAQGRWLCPVSLFMGLLAGLGADGIAVSAAEPEGVSVEAEKRITRANGHGMWILACLAALLILLGGVLCSEAGFSRAAWVRFMDAMLKAAPNARAYLHEWTPSADFKLAAMRAAGLSLLRAGLFLGALAGLVRLALQSRVKPAWATGVLLALVAIDAWTFGQRYLETFDPRKGGLSPGAVEFLAERSEPFRFARGGCIALPSCEGMTHRFACIEGVQSLVPGRFRDVFWSLQSKELYEHMKGGLLTAYRIYSLRTPLRMLNLRYLVAYASYPMLQIEGLRTVYQDEQIRIDELPDSWPRAWLVHSYAVRRDDQEVLALLSRFNYEKMALFEKQPGCAVEEPSAAEAMPEIVRYEPARVDIKVRAAAPALLVLSDLFYPGWEATVDGRPVEILQANYVMRAVAVPKGAHEVRFLYRPASFRAGVAASAAGCLAVALLILLHVRTRSRRGDT
ncbi:MAG: YfhO family protein [Candidatus Brocadiia bacterium]